MSNNESEEKNKNKFMNTFAEIFHLLLTTSQDDFVYRCWRGDGIDFCLGRSQCICGIMEQKLCSNERARKNYVFSIATGMS